MSDCTMPTLPQSMASNGWQFIDADTPRDRELLVWHAMLAVDDNLDRIDEVVGWRVYVTMRWSGDSHWPEPNDLTCKPSAEWIADDWEYADEPSLWSEMPPLMDMGGLEHLAATDKANSE